MDLQKTAREIGLFETADNLSKVRYSMDVIQKAGIAMPLPDDDIGSKARAIANWLHGFAKRQYMFLTPEIRLIEELGVFSQGNDECIIMLPGNLESDAKERVRNNIPRNIKVTVLPDTVFPQTLFPGNGMIVICGYDAAGHPMVLPDTYRLAEHYRSFHGRKVFVPYTELDTAARYDGWLELKGQIMTDRWRSNE